MIYLILRCFLNQICIKQTYENEEDVPIKVKRQEYYQFFSLCKINIIIILMIFNIRKRYNCRITTPLFDVPEDL